MRTRRMIIVGLAVAVVVSAVTAVAIVAGQPKPACGCSFEPDLRGPAQDAAARFEALVARDDVPGAWALLTDGARSRYMDAAGFQPVFDRLSKALHEDGANAGGDRAAATWLAVNERLRYDTPSEVVVVRYSTDSPRVLWPLLILVPIGHVGGERIDPELPALPMTATIDGDGIRVELADGELKLTSFVVIDGTGQRRLPSREHVSEDVYKLTWSRPLLGPVVAIAVEQNAAGPRVGAAAAVAG